MWVSAQLHRTWHTLYGLGSSRLIKAPSAFLCASLLQIEQNNFCWLVGSGTFPAPRWKTMPQRGAGLFPELLLLLPGLCGLSLGHMSFFIYWENTTTQFFTILCSLQVYGTVIP